MEPNIERDIALVVEDEALIRMGLVSDLEDEGFEVLQASSAAEALIHLNKGGEVRLIITDIEMPGSMNGLELAHHCRRRFPKIAIVIASGRVLPNRNELPHAAQFVAKPISPAMLKAIIRDFRSY